MRKKNWVLGTALMMSVLTVAPAYAGNWIQDSSRPVNENGISNWWYQNDDGSYLSNGWFWLDGNHDGRAECYYFNENGWMYGSASIDGYMVNENGAWMENGAVQYREVSNKNISSVHASKEENDEQEKDSLSYDQEDKTAVASELTDEEAYKKLLALKKDYPEGMRWTNSNTYRRGNTIGGGCIGFSFIALDHIFGKGTHSKIYRELNWDGLRVGDHIRMWNGYGGEHSVTILKVRDDSITVCEGNFNESIHWGRTIDQDELEEQFIYQETCWKETP